MRRLLAWVSIILALSAFAMVCLIFVLHVHIIIPIVLFAAALLLLYIVKRMPNDETGISRSRPNETAFFDGSGADETDHAKDMKTADAGRVTSAKGKAAPTANGSDDRKLDK